MKKFLSNRLVALLLSALIVVGSTLVSVHVKLGAQCDKITDGFYTGVKYDGFVHPSISAQLKDVVDKFYSCDDASAPTLRTKKKIGIVACGADSLTNPEYKLISDQFRCIAEFLGWEVVLDESICAAAPDDLAKDAARLAELKAAAEKL